MAHLALSLLGSFQVSLDAAAVTTVESDKVRALLAYLAVEADRPHRRESLVGMLWPDSSEQAARRNLSQALFNLRHAIGDAQATPPYLQISREALQFNSASDHTLDVATLIALLDACDAHPHQRLETCAACAQRWQNAVALYHGSFLDHFSLADGAAFEEWALVKREALHRRMLDALTRLADYYEQRGTYVEMRRYATRAIELDPWREEAHRQVMRALALSGERSAALAQYATCRRMLAAELGLEPAEETLALYRQIQRGEIESERVTVAAKRGAHLPTSLTPFVGRQHELAELARLLADPTVRLITLVGPGGIGKTRLALQSASDQRDMFVDGVAFVPLAAVAAAELMAPAITAALGFTLYGPSEPNVQLLNYLREQQLLLVLDNLEQLLSGVGLLTDILQRAPEVRLLVTSREPLDVHGEWVFPISGLPTPASTQAEGFEDYPSVALFVQRARRAQVGFALDQDARSSVARICHLVEGMPLGLELAAAWVRTLSCREIAEEIERTIDFLATSRRDAPERQRSVRAVFDHSWMLLAAEQQRVLRQLSVFRGGFRREAAAQIAGGSLRTLAGLVDKSLVGLTPGGRYHLHELLRQFSAEKLKAAPPEQAATHERHSAYFLTFLQEREARLAGKQQLGALDEIQAEVENIRSAWSWAVEQGQVEVIDRALDSLYQFYWLRSHFQEGEESFRRVVEHFPPSTIRTANHALSELEGSEIVLGKALARQGAFCMQLGRYDVASDLLQHSLAIARRLEAQVEIAFCLNFLGDVAWEQEDAPAAEQLYRESLAISQAFGDHLGMAEALARLGWLNTIINGAYLQGKRYLQQSLDLMRAMENQAGMAFLLNRLGANVFCLGEYTEGERYCQESLAYYKELNHRLGMAKATGGLGLAAWGRGEASLIEAKRLFEESLALCREAGHLPEVAYRLMFLGHIGNSMARYEEAQRYLQEALDLAKQLGYKAEAAWILSGLGETLLGLGRVQAARNYLLEAVVIAQALPNVLEAIVIWAMLLKQEADLPATGVAAGQAAPANQDKRTWAVEILSLALNHPATRQVYKDKAARLLAEFEAELPLEMWATACKHGQAKAVEVVVAAILGQTGQEGDPHTDETGRSRGCVCR
jgi:predicted ATPase/DNA-binding SARP family transcriptional activator